MPNPGLLVCDTDALVQFFIANQLTPLKLLRDDYGIQPTVVEEVEIEIRWMRRYKDRFASNLDRALKTGLVSLLDRAEFQTRISQAPPGASWESFQALGQQYEGRVDRGEAYTFASALNLGVPALSNDFSAIRTLKANMLSLPCPVLRPFDLIAFGLHSTTMTMKDCERFRKELLQCSEFIPRDFQHASVEDGLTSFAHRLMQGTPPDSTTTRDFDTPLWITMK